MGKVQSAFGNGFRGAVSRSVDSVIISKKNHSNAPIPYGAPVFLESGGTGVIPFASGLEAARFVGFTARIADKTPDTYGSNEGNYGASDPVDVLVRGSIVLEVATSSTKPGDSLYIRISDGKLVTMAGAEGTTLKIPNATVSTLKDDSGTCEVVLRERNLL